MKERGVRSWNERGVGGQPVRAVDPDAERFLDDVLAQTWAPRAGRALELGCGTGPMLRWLAERGFRGVGIDVSRDSRSNGA